MMDCESGKVERVNPDQCVQKSAPCSTFKIWNTAIGLEAGILTSPDQPFYQWDGQKRFIDAWNQDLTLRQAFAVSCVPAFQQLARKIGTQRMNTWISKLSYGDGNTSSGNDVFWLPEKGRKPLLISPDEQVQLLSKLVNGKLPFSAKTLAVLKEIMMAKKTDRGTLYGKTGTGGNTAWFVGYAESPRHTLAFACRLEGKGLTGKDARALIEQWLTKHNLL